MLSKRFCYVLDSAQGLTCYLHLILRKKKRISSTLFLLFLTILLLRIEMIRENPQGFTYSIYIFLIFPQIWEGQPGDNPLCSKGCHIYDKGEHFGEGASAVLSSSVKYQSTPIDLSILKCTYLYKSNNPCVASDQRKGHFSSSSNNS